LTQLSTGQQTQYSRLVWEKKIHFHLDFNLFFSKWQFALKTLISRPRLSPRAQSSFQWTFHRELSLPSAYSRLKRRDQLSLPSPCSPLTQSSFAWTSHREPDLKSTRIRLGHRVYLHEPPTESLIRRVPLGFPRVQSPFYATKISGTKWLTFSKFYFGKPPTKILGVEWLTFSKVYFGEPLTRARFNEKTSNESLVHRENLSRELGLLKKPHSGDRFTKEPLTKARFTKCPCSSQSRSIECIFRSVENSRGRTLLLNKIHYEENPWLLCLGACWYGYALFSAAIAFAEASRLSLCY